ncbi:MAG: hypothetical protein FWE74_07410 [Oscillospiraceae bacterium]|nr:hypothetical protein [Oscillospiraceae bacterium]
MRFCKHCGAELTNGISVTAHMIVSFIGLLIVGIMIFQPWVRVKYTSWEYNIFEMLRFMRDGSPLYFVGLLMLLASIVFVIYSLFASKPRAKKLFSIYGFGFMTISIIAILAVINEGAGGSYGIIETTLYAFVCLGASFFTLIINGCIPAERNHSYKHPCGNTCSKCNTLNTSSFVNCYKCGEEIKNKIKIK